MVDENTCVPCQTEAKSVHFFAVLIALPTHCDALISKSGDFAEDNKLLQRRLFYPLLMHADENNMFLPSKF